MSAKPKTCHKCSKMYTGWRCPRCYRKAGKASGGSRSAGRRFGMAGAQHGLSLASATPAPAPIWEADPIKFWRDVVESVRLDHNAGGQQFIMARWNKCSHTFPLDDVRDILTRYYVLPDPSQQNGQGVKA